MTGTKRRSYEAGHRPKYLVVVDDTPECDRAIYFAARRAMRIGGGLVLLTVNDEPDNHHWLGVGEIMKEEAEDAANELLDAASARGRDIAGIEAETVIRTGVKADQIRAVIEEDEDIAFLVLAASTESDGPGPLVTTLASSAAGTFPIPVVIVPGGLSDGEIDALA